MANASSSRNQSERALSATPELERLLARLGRALKRQVWMHGLGTLALVLGAWLAFAFFADWALHVPFGVRWAHLLVLLALPLVIGWRELVRHLRRLPSRAELAILVERVHPELKDLLVSAVQFQQTSPPPGSPELITRVLRDADARARTLSLEGVLRERPQRTRLGLGASLAVLLVIAGAAQPELASIFFARLFGGEVPWPQRTRLEVAIPTESDGARVETGPELIEVRVARGTDVPVLVRAIGVVPDEVELHFGSGEIVVLGASSDQAFRTLLRAAQENVEFYATGGDDRDELPRVRVTVLEPPDVAGVAVTVRPPEYTKLPPHTEVDRDVDVLAGSSVHIAMLPNPPSAHGVVRLLPDDRTLELVPGEFPPAAPGEAPRTGLCFDVNPSASLRYRFELTDDTGLSNPDPGLFGLRVVADRRPEVELLSPGRPEVETVAAGALRLRARASDDFGIVALGWRGHDVAHPDTNAALNPFELTPLPPAVTGDDMQARARVVGGARLDIASLATNSGGDGAALETGALFEIQVQAIDNRPPLADTSPDPAGIGNASVVRVRVLGAEEFLRRLQDRLARLRVQAAELDELERQKASRTHELLAAIESDQPQLDGRTNPIGAALTGQRRVQGDAEALSRELAGVLESVLYARVDEQAGGLLENLDQRLSQSSAKGFQLDAWRGLIADWRAGTSATSGLAPQLLGIVELALTISADDAPAVCAALAAASEASGLERVHEQLSSAVERQVLLQTHISELLDRLSEWDNFQSILSLARDILNRQKAVRDRTREMTQPKSK